MAAKLFTTTADFLAPYAAATMKEAAENMIERSVAEFRKQISNAIWEEVKKVSVRYVEVMNVHDPLRGKELHIEFHDSRGNPNRAS